MARNWGAGRDRRERARISSHRRADELVGEPGRGVKRREQREAGRARVPGEQAFLVPSWTGVPVPAPVPAVDAGEVVDGPSGPNPDLMGRVLT